jgi:hypothetical protein
VDFTHLIEQKLDRARSVTVVEMGEREEEYEEE